MNPRPESRGKLLRFGPFELDSKAGELRKHGLRVRLQEQPFQLLVCLIENQGAVVTREALAGRIWADGTFVDYEHGLNAALARLRQILRDSAESPRYIETVARRGYRFIAPVSEVAGSEPEQRPATAMPRPSHKLRILWVALGAAASIALVALGLRFHEAAKSPIPYSVLPFTSYVGSEFSPSFAPDGDRVAFSWDGENQGNFDIYVKQIGAGAPSCLTTDARPDLSPAWSPDGTKIAFLRIIAEDKAQLLVMHSLTGGGEQLVAEVVLLLEQPYWRSKLLSWSPDGKWLVVAEAVGPGAPAGLSAVSVESGEKRRLTNPKGEDDFCPAISPDGKRLVFSRYAGWHTGDLYLLDVTDDLRPRSEPKRLTFEHRQIGSPAWTPDGHSVVFSRFSLAGIPGLWRITPGADAHEEPLPISAENVTTLSIAPKGDRLVFARDLSNPNIWAVELPAAIRNHRKIVPKPWISSTFASSTPQFSPDGRQIAFQSLRSGRAEIWLADRDGSHPRQLTDLKAVIAGFPHWSPDGRKIVFHLRQQTEAVLYVIDLPTGRPRRVAYEAANDFAPAWSHDGRWIYFSSRRSGETQIWKIPAEGGAAIRVTKNGGAMSAESIDGKELFFARTLGSTDLWSMTLPAGAERKVLTGVAGNGTAYSPARTGIYFIRKFRESAGLQLAFLSFATGEIRPVAKIPAPLDLGFAISPDERLLLYSQIEQVNSDLMLVENFR